MAWRNGVIASADEALQHVIYYGSHHFWMCWDYVWCIIENVTPSSEFLPNSQTIRTVATKKRVGEREGMNVLQNRQNSHLINMLVKEYLDRLKLSFIHYTFVSIYFCLFCLLSSAVPSQRFIGVFVCILLLNYSRDSSAWRVITAFFLTSLSSGAFTVRVSSRCSLSPQWMLGKGEVSLCCFFSPGHSEGKTRLSPFMWSLHGSVFFHWKCVNLTMMNTSLYYLLPPCWTGSAILSYPFANNIRTVVRAELGFISLNKIWFVSSSLC